MHLTYDQLRRLASEEGVSPDQMCDIPLSGFVNGVVMGAALWVVIGWVVWSLIL